jgi:hypothetical protein
MSQKSTQELQQLIERHELVVRDLEKRVKDLENYVRSVQRTLAKSGIKAPTL